MSARLSPATPRSKSHRGPGGETDTTPPFQSVKAGVNMLADKGPRSTERRSTRTSGTEKRLSSSKGAELQQAHEELAKTKERLASVESVNVQSLQELGLMKRLVEELTIKLREAVESSKKDRVRADEMEHASFTAAEDWQAELEAMKRQYEAEMQTMKQALENLKHEFVAAREAKEEAVRLAGEAMTAAETTAKRAELLNAQLLEARGSLAETNSATDNLDELLDELSAARKDLAKSYAAHENTAQEGAAMVAAKEVELKKAVQAADQAKTEAEQLRQQLFMAREFESQISNMNILLENLKGELAASKEAEAELSSAAVDGNANLERAKFEIEQAKLAESKAVSLLASVSVELEESRKNWSKANGEVTTLTASLDSLRTELGRNQTQLLELKQKESDATAEAAALRAMLVKVKQDLEEALIVERNGKETVRILSASLQEAKMEAQVARQEASTVMYEAQRATREAAAMNVEAQAARDQVLTLSEAMRAAKEEAQGALLETQQAKTDVQAAREEVKVARAEAEAAREEAHAAREEAWEARGEAQAGQKEVQAAKAETQAAREEAHAAREEAWEARGEAQAAQKEVQAAKAETQAEREQARSAREEARAAIARVENLKAEVKRARLDIEEAMAAANVTESKLRDAVREVEAVKFSDSNTLDKNRDAPDKSREFSESWEMVESGSDVGITISQEEYDTLKMKLQEAEELRAAARIEVDATKRMNDGLSKKLDAANLEIEAIKMSVLQAQQQLEKAENENLILEAEVQRLTANREHMLKAWEAEPNGTSNSEMNGNSIPLVSQEKRLQPDSLGQMLNKKLSTLDKEEEDESGEVPRLPKKKKKKAFFLRIGTYLAKKKNQ